MPKIIWAVLHSDRAVKLREELERAQCRDIALLRAYALRDKDLKAFAAAIAARGQMIKNLTPNSQPNVNVDVKVDNKIDVSKEVEEIIKFSREEVAGK